MSEMALGRVTYVCGDAGVPVFGRKGCSVHVREILRAMARRGAEIRLIARRLGGVLPHDVSSLTIEPGIAADAKPPLGTHSVDDWNRAAHRALVAGNRPELIYERHSIWSCAPMEWASAIGVRGILEVNSPLIEEQARHRILDDRPKAERASRRCFEAAATVVAVSDRVAQYALEHGAAPERIFVEPNGVDPLRFAEPGHPASETFTVGFVGTLKPWHGLASLGEAFGSLVETHPHARLLVVGDGPGRKDLEDDLDRRGVGRLCEFAGAADPDLIPALLRRMHVGVAPYPAQDDDEFYFSPLKVLEYMAAGLPVVASEIGQIPALVRHGREGWLTRPGDAVSLTSALQRLADTPELRIRMGAAGRTRARAHFSWDAVLQRSLSAGSTCVPELER